MGVYLSFFAIDLPRFQETLNQSLVDLLWLSVKHSPEDHGLHFSDLASSAGMYEALPKFGCVRVINFGQDANHNKPSYRLTEEETHAIPFLSTTIREYIRQNASDDLLRFLQTSTLFPAGNWVKLLGCSKRAWIGSFLDGIEQSELVSPHEYERLVILFQKVLRGYSAYKPLPERVYAVTDFVLPVIPSADDGPWMGVWSQTETTFVLRLIHQLLDKKDKLRFGIPPDVTYRDNEDEATWNDWVYEMLGQLLQAELLNFAEVNIISFIEP